MSILIKGMEMPAVCADCDFCIETEDDHKCSRTKESLGLFAFEMTRGMKCPIGYIPKKHGDLIDRDALRDNNCDVFEINGADKTILAMDVSIIDDASAIIPASE